MLLKNLFPLVKQHGALLAKGRLSGVQFGAMFSDGLYYEIGHHAVALALRIREAFRAKGYEVVIESPTNQQFFRLPNEVIDSLRAEVSFDYWGARGTTHSIVRFVTSWSTTSQDVDRLIELL
jgi:threonine aldolase